MNWKKLLLAVPLLALTYAPPAEAKDRHRDGWKRHNQQSYRYRYNDNGNYNNRNGYTGRDRNRDGVIDRREWRGNNRSFKQLDRNRDGLITPQDRYRSNDSRYRYNYGR